MNNTPAQLTAEAIRAIDARLDALESQLMAARLLIEVLVQTHPQPDAVAAALDNLIAALPGLSQEHSANPPIPKAALDRLRLYRQLLDPAKATDGT